MSQTDETAAAGLGAWWLRPWLQRGGLAPQALSQPILPGWTFGNIIVDEHNSSAPDTERRIVADNSYGRQIGKLLDAVCALVEAQPNGKALPAYVEVVQLREKVEASKDKAAAARLDQLAHDLARLRAAGGRAYHERVAVLRALLPPDDAR